MSRKSRSSCRRPSRASRSGRLATALVALTVAGSILSLPPRDGDADDRDLLRFNTAKPYVFLLLDTSGSMNLAPGDQWLPGGGDDPGSKIHQAKEALYEVFRDIDDIHVGFATFNQDDSRMRSKHWRYVLARDGNELNNNLQAGEMLTFGRHLVPGEGDNPEVVEAGTLGTCDSPVSLVNQRELIQQFPLLGTRGTETTTLWVTEQGKTYKILATETDSAYKLGQSQFFVTFDYYWAFGCGGDDLSYVGKDNLEVNLVTEFLGWDDVAGNDAKGGQFDLQDIQTAAACEDSHPFTGKGWEGNYDSGVVTGDPDFDAEVTEVDEFCSPGGTCRNLKQETTLSAVGRELDRGDMIPFHWTIDNVETFLQRLAPNTLDGELPDFGVARYFEDFPDADGYLSLRNPGRRPIFAAGTDTPLGKAIADFRCWYFGQGTNKCGSFGAPAGWENLAKDSDSEWGCRRPYLIVISDGEDSCPGENPCADTANMNAKGGVRSWVLTYGGDDRPPLSCIARNGKGELIFVDDKNDLVAELNRVLGEIREEARSFATATSPSVQAKVADKIYLSHFTPLNNKSIWDGHLNAFLRPLPLANGKPDLTSERFLWDAGLAIRDHQSPSQATADGGDLRLGPNQDQRRLFYSRVRDDDGIVRAGGWPFRRRLLDVTEDVTPAQVRYDLWRAFEIPFSTDVGDPPVVDQVAQDRANQVLADVVAIKQHTLDNGSEIEYVLGDIFHSNPVVVGRPSNTRFFALDLEGDGTSCESGNPGYRCFFKKHHYRRKMLLVGTNDGLFHAIDAGRPRTVLNGGIEEIQFDNGTGKEIFGFMPRDVMPTVRRLAEGVSHHFTVDGNIVAADVFIDPRFDGAPVAEDREWRTVAIGGLREGGSAYYALDITQPDILDEDNLPPDDDDYTPGCLGPLPLADGAAYPNDDCGPVPFPAVLWEFDDSVLDTTAIPARYRRLDEDLNGAPDLADAWSTSNIGMIEVCEGDDCDPAAENNDVVRKHVAIFGGGMDPDNKHYDPRSGADPGSLRGDWLYIVDIETGEPIYKRRLTGSAPSEPAAVDSDQDGLLDRIYIGTLAGYLYRVDLHRDSTGEVPALADLSATDIDGVAHTVRRIPTQDASGHDLWEPRIIFDANFDGGSATDEPRPIYHRPSVIFVARLGLYALAFGTGEREDLWATTQQDGRLYVFVDDTDLLEEDTVLTEGDLAVVTPDSVEATEDYLVSRDIGRRGWFMPLDLDERVITDAFAVSGVGFFSTFNPDIEVSGGRDPLCSKTGVSRVFVIDLTNANPFLRGVDELSTRYFEVSTFVTNPYTEMSQTKNTVDDGSGTTTSGTGLPEQLQEVMRALQALFPSNCKFANYRIDIKTITADTGVVHVAPVPVCIIEKNWREF